MGPHRVVATVSRLLGSSIQAIDGESITEDLRIRGDVAGDIEVEGTITEDLGIDGIITRVLDCWTLPAADRST